MKKFWLMGACAALFLAVFALTPDVAMAADPCTTTTGTDAGKSLFQDVIEFIQGTPGKLVGLILALAGAYVWIVQQSTLTGVLFLLAGALLTITPQLYVNLADFICTALDNSIEAGGSGPIRPQ